MISFISPMVGRSRVRLDTSLELLLERAPKVPEARVLATLIATAGSTYRKPGARMLIMADGSYLGLLSGGCLEADLRLHALDVLKSGTARAVEYDMRGPDDILFGIGAGCEGAMRVLLEPAHRGSPAAAALAAAGSTLREGHPACLVAIHESTRWPLGTYSTETLPAELVSVAQLAMQERASREGARIEGALRFRAFADFLAPAPHLLICGAGPDAKPLKSAARDLGWRVSVFDHRPAYASAEQFGGAAVICADPLSLRSKIDLESCHAAVVMSHHLASDIAYLRELGLANAPGYVGLLGPAARRDRIAEELGATFTSLRGRLRSPVGIDIGAMTPEGIALAILAELHAWLANRPS